MTRAVVTGIGIASPNGLGPTAYWRATLQGETAIKPITRFDSANYWAKIAGEVPGFEAGRHLQGRLLPQTDHMTRLTLVGTDWALRGAGVQPNDIPDTDIAVITAATAGGYEFGQRELQKLWHQGPEYVSAYQSFAWFYAVNTGQISIRHGTRGPGAVVVSEQAGGIDSIGHARRQLRKGVQLALTGGMDSSLCPWAWVAHQASGRLSRNNNPRRAYLPFDRDASGYVAGEGGAIMVLETPESASERPGTRIYGEIVGYASTFDSRMPSREPGLKRAAELALRDAGMDASEIDVVFADAAGIPELDKAEAEAIKGIFGPYGVPVTAPKTMTGRLFAGGGSLDVASAILSIYWSAIPPTVNVENPVPEYELDLVMNEARHGKIKAALVLGRGKGGFNSAMVVREYR
ncbi:ketosynthase chain-length factor [Lentzea cavernae]|uniref:Actinorhodin polyketide putative beta-ketoacyl synthase 2 n=1 Tax=Lentzea cavernae TaxID=2020703 RepID=A0ABQ3MLQ3_9PSEU|nr:ketosynthase chain-length factor [Lentzea cavernae]GHH52562.1 actinorhodin polyketide putative beta-ketoacyl synthase 2 [Lentzea cavernae]